MRKYIPEAGEPIHEACANALKMAENVRGTIEFEFNGIEMKCPPGANPERLVQLYNERYEARRAKLRKSQQKENTFYCPHCGAWLKVGSA